MHFEVANILLDAKINLIIDKPQFSIDPSLIVYWVKLKITYLFRKSRVSISPRMAII